MRALICLILIFAAACGASQGPYERPSYAPPPVSTAATPGQAEMISMDGDQVSGFFSKKAKGATPEMARATGGSGEPESPVSIDQKLVKNAWLTVQLKDEKYFAEAVKKAEGIARNLKGYVANTSHSSITFKIPTGRLDEALAAISELGKVKHRDVATVDVTANYVDMQIRIENLRKLRARLQELVEQGKNVEEILAVEKELARVTSQLEALEGQMRVLENQTSYATMTVTFEERVRPGPVGWVFYGLYHGVKWLFVWD